MEISFALSAFIHWRQVLDKRMVENECEDSRYKGQEAIIHKLDLEKT